MVFFHNLEGERIMTLHSAHSGDSLLVEGDGFVECTIPELRLVTGEYSLMIDYGRGGGFIESIDCVPNATTVEVTLGNYLAGVGLTSNQGWIAQRSTWSVCAKEGGAAEDKSA
jgi:lipopolysaccharide transport system ATP-binding protein